MIVVWGHTENINRNRGLSGALLFSSVQLFTKINFSQYRCQLGV